MPDNSTQTTIFNYDANGNLTNSYVVPPSNEATAFSFAPLTGDIKPGSVVPAVTNGKPAAAIDSSSKTGPSTNVSTSKSGTNVVKPGFVEPAVTNGKPTAATAVESVYTAPTEPLTQKEIPPQQSRSIPNFTGSGL